MCVPILSHTYGIWLRAWRAFTRWMRERYHPEKHYMRGPGPKFRAQHVGHNAGTPKTNVPRHANDNTKGA
jgi:hypothetical protein